MAQIPLNNFKLVTKVLQDGDNTMYNETQKDLTGIVLSAQISNVSEEDQTVSIKLNKDGEGEVFLLKEAIIPPNDSLNPLSGKLVLEKNDELIFEAFEENSLHAVLSILENANE